MSEIQCPHCGSFSIRFLDCEYEELPIEYSDVAYEQRRGAKYFLVDEYECIDCDKTFKEISRDDDNDDDEDDE